MLLAIKRISLEYLKSALAQITNILFAVAGPKSS